MRVIFTLLIAVCTLIPGYAQKSNDKMGHRPKGERKKVREANKDYHADETNKVIEVNLEKKAEVNEKHKKWRNKRAKKMSKNNNRRATRSKGPDGFDF